MSQEKQSTNYSIDELRIKLLDLLPQTSPAYTALINFYNTFDLDLYAYKYFILLTQLEKMNFSNSNTFLNISTALQERIHDLIRNVAEGLLANVEQCLLKKSLQSFHYIYRLDLLLTMNLVFMENFNKDITITNAIKNFLENYYNITHFMQREENIKTAKLYKASEDELNLLLSLSTEANELELTVIDEKIARIISTMNDEWLPPTRSSSATHNTNLKMSEEMPEAIYYDREPSLKTKLKDDTHEMLTELPELIALVALGELPECQSSNNTTNKDKEYNLDFLANLTMSTSNGSAWNSMPPDEDTELQKAIMLSLTETKSNMNDSPNRVQVETMARNFSSFLSDPSISSQKPEQAPGGPK